MKLSDVLNEEQIDELGTTPMGIGARLGYGALSKLGSSSAQAKLDVGKRANRFEKAFSGWARRSGLDLENIKDVDIDDFLNAHGLPNYDHKGVSSYDMSDNTVTRDLWTKVANQTYRAAGAVPAGKPKLGAQLGVPASPTPRTFTGPRGVKTLTSYAGSLSKSDLYDLLRNLTSKYRSMP